MASKAGFQLVIPPPTAENTLTKKGTTISICGDNTVGGQIVTVADIEAAMIAQGLTSPNGNPALEIVCIYGTNAPTGRITRDQQTDTDIPATGALVTYTNEGGDVQNVNAGERAGAEVCLVDANGDNIPDATIPDTVAWNIPENACVMFEVDYA